MGRIKQGKHMNKSDITCWGGNFFSLFLMLVESVVRCLKMYNCHKSKGKIFRLCYFFTIRNIAEVASVVEGTVLPGSAM